MKTVTTNLYQFDELSDDAKAKVLERFYDINTCDSFWYENVLEDAKEIGLKIDEFDIDRGSYCKGAFLWNASDVAEAIISNHGETCETWKTARVFLDDTALIRESLASDDLDDTEYYNAECKLEEAADDFLQSLLEDYRIMLTKEYEYQSSEEAVIETIRCNEYEFDQLGNFPARVLDVAVC